MLTISVMTEQLRRASAAVRREIERELSKKVGNLAVREFKENFRREGFFGKKWKEVKRRAEGARGAAGRRKILTGPTGDLGRSIKYEAGSGSVTVYSDVPYAEAHNAGTANAGRSHSVKIPRRQFIGEDPKLSAAIERKIEEEIGKALDL